MTGFYCLQGLVRLLIIVIHPGGVVFRWREHRTPDDGTIL
jgi:hypothetical protein